jgi:hypothetical protein
VSVGLTAFTAPFVLAAGRTDTGDHFSLAKGTAVSSSLKSGTKLTLSATIDKAPVTATCTTFAFSFTTPATGLGPVDTTLPKIAGCTDNLKGTDKFATKGTFTLTLVDAPNDEAAEKPGDALKVTIPSGGIAITTSVAPGCVITVKLPGSGGISISGAYNDVNTAVYKSASVPYATSAACPGGATTGRGAMSGTIILSKSVHDVS